MVKVMSQCWGIPGCRGWAGRSSQAPSCRGGEANECGKAEGNGSRRSAGRESERSEVTEIGWSRKVSKWRIGTGTECCCDGSSSGGEGSEAAALAALAGRPGPFR